MKQNNLLSYVITYIAFLIQRIDVTKIDNIILFGSAVTGEATPESDIDIFIDTKENLSHKINSVTDEFYKSKSFLLYRLNNIHNLFSIKVGQLSKYKELHRSISSKGIVLYSKFEPSELPIGATHKVIFYWDAVGINRGAFLNKLYGFTIKGRKYQGLVSLLSGKRMGKSCIILPFDKMEEIVTILKKYRVNAKMVEVYGLE